MTKKIKIILSALLLALAIGYVSLYFWAKNRFIELNQESIQQMQAEGWVIEGSPLIFSGFPFRLTATQEQFKATQDKSGLAMLGEGQSIKMHVSIINPFKCKFEGAASLSVTQKGLPIAKVVLENGTITMAHQGEKLGISAITLESIKADMFNPQGAPAFSIQTAVQYEDGEYKVSDTSDGQIVQIGGEYTLKDFVVMAEKDGALAPLTHLKKVKATAKGKMPMSVLETVKSLVKDPTTSPVAKICQEGGKVPPLKATIDFMEKIESFGKVNIEVEHDNYIINVDIDAKFKKADIELMITTQVNNLNSLFDAFNLDPTVRLFAHGFVKKESDKSEKAKVIMKLSEGKLFLNDMEVMKAPTPDWDNIVLPADVCSKYNATAAASTAPAPAASMVATPL